MRMVCHRSMVTWSRRMLIYLNMARGKWMLSHLNMARSRWILSYLNMARSR